MNDLVYPVKGSFTKRREYQTIYIFTLVENQNKRLTQQKNKSQEAKEHATKEGKKIDTQQGLFPRTVHTLHWERTGYLMVDVETSNQEISRERVKMHSKVKMTNIK